MSNNDWAAYQAGVYAAAAGGSVSDANISAGYYGDVGSTAYYQGEAAVRDVLTTLGYKSGDPYTEAWLEAEGLIGQEGSIIENLLAKIEELLKQGARGAREWIIRSLLESENFILRGLGGVAMALLEGLEWVGSLVWHAIEALGELIDAALEALADFFGDVFEIILKHLVDYAGEKIDTYIDFALGAK